MSGYISGLDPLPSGEVPRPAENPDNRFRNKSQMVEPFVDHARTAAHAEGGSAECRWCGHVHDPEDGHCDAHANVGVGRCTCPGEGLVVAYDKINAALYAAEQDCAELRGNLQAAMMDREALRGRLAPVERLQSAGDRLAVCLRSSFNVDGYGSPEHEAACREALREWQWERRS